MSMEDYKPLISCLSRAIGNDLVRFELIEDECVLHIWPPIAPITRRHLGAVIKHFHPNAKVVISPKRGIIRIRPNRK